MQLLNYTKYIKAIGVYYIENIVNNKKYVGGSIDLYSRLNTHKKSLNKNKKAHIHLQNDWDEFGAKNFKTDVLELCSKEDLAFKEQFWLDKFNSIHPNGYNIRTFVSSNKGISPSEATRQKKRDIMKVKAFWKGKHLTKAARRKMSVTKRSQHLKSPQAIKVGLYNDRGELLSSYNSMLEASKILNISTACISVSIKLNYKTKKGTWKKI